VAQVAGGSTDRRSGLGLRGTPPAHTATLVRSGEYWTIGYEGTTFSLKDIKGLSYIQRLLQHPGEEFHALDLLSGAGASIGRAGDAGEMLDAQAKQDYKRRLIELREELEERRERGDHEGGAKVESEIDFLINEMTRAVGLGGRDRRAGSAAERARLSVTRAIKAAVQKISEHHSSLGEVLGRSVRTGLFCCYVPDPGVPIIWQFLLEGVQPSVEAEATAPLLQRNETKFLYALTDRTTFVGREKERASLRRHLEEIPRATGRVVMIGGAAGVGKSRIAAEAGVEASQRGFLVLAGSCYDRDDSVPFIPFVEILETALAQAPNPQTFREVLDKDASEMARLMPQLRRLFPDIPPPLQVSPEQSRRILFNAVVELLARTAALSPMLLLLEDLHWADEGTLSLFNHLAQSVAKMPVMIIGTYRDSGIDSGGSLAKTLGNLIRLHLVDRMSLSGLSQNGVAEMIRALSGREPPKPVVTLIYSNTDGNPFFVEEMFRHLVERGKLTDPQGEFRSTLNLAEIDVPHSLRLVIGRRLARLSEVTQKTLATAAVIGRSFSIELLEASTRTDVDSLLDCLDEAERAGLISSTLQYPEARFKFSHELIRQAVVTRLSDARHQRLHLSVAHAIEQLYPNALDERADDLAHHLWQAGAAADTGKTIRYLRMAGEQAVQRSANVEAVGYLTKALELLKTNQALPDRAQQELSLQLALGVPLVLTKGHSAPEVEATYNRARELCQQATEGPELFSVLLGLRRFYFHRGELQPALELGAQLLTLAQSLRDSSRAARAHLMQGEVLYVLGDFAKAKENFEQGVALYNPGQGRSDSFVYGNDTRTSCLSYQALVLWLFGFPDQALKMSQRALTLGREIAHPFNLAFTLTWTSVLYQHRCEEQRALEQAEEVVNLASEKGFALWWAWGTVLQGWALATKEKSEEGIAKMRQGLDAWQSIGAEVARPQMLTLLAHACRRLEQTEEGLSVVRQALTLGDKTGERLCEAELHRLRGELSLQSRQVKASQGQSIEEAESHFLKAIEIARRQQAKSLELRASTSLSRHWQRLGKKQQARRLLAEIYGWFTEGFDTSDLKEAKALLEELV
jgi:predicted ATPase